MPLIASGRTADVLDLGDGRVLRRYRDPAHDCTAEATAMRHLREHGFPVPEVHAAAGTDLVMSRVAGPTLAEAALCGSVAPAHVGEVLAELHLALDAVEPHPGLVDAGVVAGDALPRVLHLDLHPENVLLGTDGPVVIDWTNVAGGPAGLDRAVTALILAEVVLGAPPGHRLGDVVRAALDSFLGRTGPLAPAMMGEALARRRTDPHLTRAEVDRLGAAAELLT
ncbi:MAG TPA: phosphotransferase [Dermatophilaceae bacterium]|nr:phosphotransferase [Dermatophilaceae bacterium]